MKLLEFNKKINMWYYQYSMVKYLVLLFIVSCSTNSLKEKSYSNNEKLKKQEIRDLMIKNERRKRMLDQQRIIRQNQQMLIQQRRFLK